MKKMIFRNSMIYNQNFLIPVSMKSIINFYSMCFSLNSLISRMVATLQVVHNNDHWVLVAKTEAGHVSIYDSLAQSCWRRPHTLSCASSLLQTSEKHLLYKVKSCQQQNNGFDCGVNAVAFATSVAHGVDPITVIYDRRTLRSHLQKLLAAENFTPFPSTKGYPTRGTQSTQSAEEILQKENVYCSCRRTEHRLPPKDWYMVQCESCNELYHRMCHLLCE